MHTHDFIIIVCMSLMVQRCCATVCGEWYVISRVCVCVHVCAPESDSPCCTLVRGMLVVSVCMFVCTSVCMCVCKCVTAGVSHAVWIVS